ncbi:hypothetical protein F2Q69_00010468 [Brassica cretica]|uniref:Uncharacterized protein n=1 Tax=Brassica cretica TaxID=69181 RepID=A0A8S9QUG7_BRACR|nr:hypothetical protein F2Q69_00010468 [Brassica cretica]
MLKFFPCAFHFAFESLWMRHEEEAPNDRKIGKLCEYAAKNAIRMPEISDLLEQRCYKELRNENFQSAKIVMCIYRWLLVTCKEQMPLFSSGFLRTVQALLDQTRQVEMQIVGCQSLFEFVNNQTDGSSLFNLEGFLPKLGQLALEVGDDDRSRSLRAAGLQALSAMIWLMGEYSHIPSDFDNVSRSQVVAGVLENYGHPKKSSNTNDSGRKWVDEVLKNEGHLAHTDSLINVPSWRTVVNDKGELNVKMEDSLDPSFWSKVCLHNMANLGFSRGLVPSVTASYGPSRSQNKIDAHRIFSVKLVPTSVCPHPSSTITDLKKGMGLSRSLSRTASVFSSSTALFEKLTSTALFEKLRKENISSVPTSDQRQIKMLEEESGISSGEILDRLTSSYSQAYRSWNLPVTSVADNSVLLNSELDAVYIRLSSHQIGLLLSSIWAQSISANTPDNYEAITNTYSLVLLFSRGKVIYIFHISILPTSASEIQGALIRSFQMALSLRDVSLTEGGPLPPSRRRSLFTMATSMVLFSSKAFNLFSLADFAKVALQGPTLDPFLHLVEDHKLKAVNPDQLQTVAYGCQKDDASALDTLSNIEVSTEHSRGALVYEIVKSLQNICSSGMEKIQEQLLSDFMPDDACPLGTIVLEDTQKPFQADFGDVKPQNLAALFSHEDQESGDVTETAADDNPVTVAGIPDLLTVDQILESVVETIRQMDLISFDTVADASYKEMTFHCENLLMGKQQKISNLFNSHLQHESSVNGSPPQHDEEIKIATFHPMINFHAEDDIPLLGKEFVIKSPRTPLRIKSPRTLMGTIQTQCYSELQNSPQAYKLPASTPYDSFFEASGC